MADNLTQLIAKVQATVGDGGTLFTNATVTAAIREALNEINKAAPQLLAVTFPAIDNQKVYEISDQDILAGSVIDVLLQGEDDDEYSLTYYAYVEDGRSFIRLRNALPSTETLIVRYSRPHTISGLDGATDSTLSDALNVAAIDGGVCFSCLIRSAATLESNNIAEQVPANWMALANQWQDIFQRSLARASREPSGRGEPSAAAWNDAHHDPSYP